MSQEVSRAGESEPLFACSPDWQTWWQSTAIRSQVMDGFEKLLILGLYVFFLRALSTSMQGALSHGKGLVIGDVMLLITETIMVMMVLIRRPATDLSLRSRDWVIALSATCLSLLARPVAHEPYGWEGIGTVLAILGLSTQLFAKLTLGRRFGLVAANRGICRSGPYRFVRHPIYFGYVMLHLGFFLLNPSLWNLAVFALLYSIKIPRIFAEEHLLERDPLYREYQSAVRYRLIPGLF